MQPLLVRPPDRTGTADGVVLALRATTGDEREDGGKLSLSLLLALSSIGDQCFE